MILYVLAVVLDALSFVIRYFIGQWIGGPAFGVLLAGLPLALSLATLLGLPSGRVLTRFELGARQASEREKEKVEQAFSQLSQYAQTHGIVVKCPTTWYVLDRPSVNALVIGTTLYLNRAAITSQYLTPILAHELGHYNSLDGRLTIALRRLIFPGALTLGGKFLGMGEWSQQQAGYTHHVQMGTSEGFFGTRYTARTTGVTKNVSVVGCVFLLIGAVFVFGAGGLGIALLGPAWGPYWRAREYAADLYAARLGQAAQLAETLEANFLQMDFAVPWMKNMKHPYTELRIDRLYQYLRSQQYGTGQILPQIQP